MRKILVLSLVIMLIPLTYGCRLLGDYDDDVGVTPVASNVVANIPFVIKIPTTITTATSIRNNFLAADANFWVVLNDNSEVELVAGTTSGGLTTYTAKSRLPVSKLTLEGTNYKIKIKIKANSSELFFYVKVPSALKADSSGLANDVTVEIRSLSFDSSGKATVVYVVAYTNLAGSAATTSAATDTSDITAFYVAKVEYAGYKESKTATTLSGTPETLSLNNPISGVDYNYPVFRVTFNEQIIMPSTFTIEAEAVDSVNKTKITFTKAGGQLEIEQSADKKSIIAYVTGQGESINSSLNPNTTYKVTVQADVKSSQSNKTLSVNNSYKFVTKKVTLVLWQAYDANDVQVGTGTPDSIGTATVATAKIKLTFDYPVKVPNNLSGATFTKSGTNAKTKQAYTDYFENPTLDATGKVMTIALKPDKKLVPGSYTISYDGTAGILVDRNGKELDTSLTIRFNVPSN